MSRSPNPQVLRAPKPRNPVALALRQRRGGAHGPQGGARRQAAHRALQRELRTLPRQGP